MYVIALFNTREAYDSKALNVRNVYVGNDFLMEFFFFSREVKRIARRTHIRHLYVYYIVRFGSPVVISYTSSETP